MSPNLKDCYHGTEGSMAAVSADIADWSRERPRQLWDPSRKLLAAIRSYQRCRLKSGLIPLFTCKIAVLRHRFWSVITGADIPLNCHIGGGLLLPHPNGIVIHPHAVIGVNCLIFQQVTIGSRAGDDLPTIGGHVDIGAGAKILGKVTIGDHARIGANAVVTRSVPAHGTATGFS
jgi:serine O-acetyltransferase